MKGGRKNKTGRDEVEELLRAAEDDVLLKLSVDSHIKSSNNNVIDPDLDRRFQALRSRPTPSKIKPSPLNSAAIPPNPQPITGGDHENPDVDDLFARFAALKGSLPSYSSTTTSNDNDQQQKSNDDHGDGVDDEDEVAKVIRWAMDAARLDPSPCSDDDDIDGDDSGDDDEGGGDDSVRDKKKGQAK